MGASQEALPVAGCAGYVIKNGAARILAVLYTIYLLDIQRHPAAVAYAEQRAVNDLAVLRVPVDLLQYVTVGDADV